MREAHRLVRGQDPFVGIETTRGNLRHELERETRGKLLQLRAQHAALASSGKELTRLLVESASTFFVLMRALVRLEQPTPPDHPAQLVQRASEIASLDVQAFDWVVEKISGGTVRALKPYDETGSRYVDAMEALAHFVDSA